MSVPCAAAPDPSRRALLRGGTRGEIPMRPPWARAEADFVDACTRCNRCIDACPQRILRRGDGGFPVVAFDGSECTFCRECVIACAPQALDPMQLQPWSWQAVVGGSCLAHAGIVCQSCRDVCPERAIAFPVLATVAYPKLDASRCSGCGACVGVCPPGAIVLRPGMAAAP